jgi:hypothetical protein
MPEEKKLTGPGFHPNSRAALKANQFRPGQSGNPAGRPKTVLKRLEVGEHVGEMRRVLSKIVGHTFTGRIEVDVSEGTPGAMRLREALKESVQA